MDIMIATKTEKECHQLELQLNNSLVACYSKDPAVLAHNHEAFGSSGAGSFDAHHQDGQ
jgi:hypothetical protein